MEHPVSQPPLTILIIDDNPVDVHLIRWVLEAHGLAYDVQVIDNGDRALEVFAQLAQHERHRAPTIILLDLHLPQRDGKDLLRHLRTIAPGDDIRVVIVTGSANPQERADTLALGADAFFPKPFHLTQFMPLGEIIKTVAFGPAAQGASGRATCTA
jgi:CheY-like chemotaxis protein